MPRTYTPTGLVAFWKMDDATGAPRVNALNPGTLDLGVVGSPQQITSVPKAFHLATQCNQDVDWLFLNGSAGLNIGMVFSIAGWFLTADQNASQGLSIYGDTASGNAFMYGNLLGFGGGAAVDFLSQGEQSTVLHSISQYALIGANFWYFFAFVYDGNTQRVIIPEPAIDVSTSLNGLSLSGNRFLHFGGTAGKPSLQFANVGLWRRALTMSDVMRMYNGNTGLPGVPT